MGMNWLERLTKTFIKKAEKQVLKELPEELIKESSHEKKNILTEPILPQVSRDGFMEELTQAQQLAFCIRIACLDTRREINKWAAIELGRTFTNQHIYSYKKREPWASIIDEQRKKFLQLVSDIGLAHKVKRVEKLAEWFDHMEDYEENQDKLTGKLKCVDRLIRILDQIHTEMEGKGANIQIADLSTNIHVTKYSGMTRTELEKERLRLIETLSRLKGEPDSEVLPLESEA